MRKRLLLAVLALLLVLAVAVPYQRVQAASGNACWGQATKVFAATGTMGEHSSQMATPRMGLRNLARSLYADGTIADDSMAALGQFVAGALGYSIEACMTVE